MGLISRLRGLSDHQRKKSLGDAAQPISGTSQDLPRQTVNGPAATKSYDRSATAGTRKLRVNHGNKASVAERRPSKGTQQEQPFNRKPRSPSPQLINFRDLAADLSEDNAPRLAAADLMADDKDLDLAFYEPLRIDEIGFDRDEEITALPTPPPEDDDRRLYCKEEGEQRGGNLHLEHTSPVLPLSLSGRSSIPSWSDLRSSSAFSPCVLETMSAEMSACRAGKLQEVATLPACRSDVQTTDDDLFYRTNAVSFSNGRTVLSPPSRLIQTTPTTTTSAIAATASTVDLGSLIGARSRPSTSSSVSSSWSSSSSQLFGYATPKRRQSRQSRLSRFLAQAGHSSSNFSHSNSYNYDYNTCSSSNVNDAGSPLHVNKGNPNPSNCNISHTSATAISKPCHLSNSPGRNKEPSPPPTSSSSLPQTPTTSSSSLDPMAALSCSSASHAFSQIPPSASAPASTSASALASPAAVESRPLVSTRRAIDYQNQQCHPQPLFQNFGKVQPAGDLQSKRNRTRWE